MAKHGLDLGEVMMKSAEPYEGRGGGHDIAAGAFLPEANQAEFLQKVDTLVGEQLKT